MKYPRFPKIFRPCLLGLAMYSGVCAIALAADECVPPAEAVAALLEGRLDDVSMAPLARWALDCTAAKKNSMSEVRAAVERAMVATQEKRNKESEMFRAALAEVSTHRLVLFQHAFTLHRNDKSDENLAAQYDGLPPLPPIPEHLRHRIYDPVAVPDLVDGPISGVSAKGLPADRELWKPRDYAVKLRAEMDVLDRMAFISDQNLRESGPRLNDARAELARRLADEAAAAQVSGS